MMVEVSPSLTLGIRSCCTQMDPQSVVAHFDPDPRFVEDGGPSMMCHCWTLGWVLFPLPDYPKSSVSQIGWPYARVKPSYMVK
jgi:hypothetical protein